jgi:hypothetical protein
MFTTGAVPVYWLLALAVPTVPLESGSVVFESGKGGNEDVSGDEDDDEIGAPVPPGDVALAADVGTVEFGIGNGGDTEADMYPDETEVAPDEILAGEVPL